MFYVSYITSATPGSHVAAVSAIASVTRGSARCSSDNRYKTGCSPGTGIIPRIHPALPAWLTTQAGLKYLQRFQVSRVSMPAGFKTDPQNKELFFLSDRLPAGIMTTREPGFNSDCFSGAGIKKRCLHKFQARGCRQILREPVPFQDLQDGSSQTTDLRPERQKLPDR